MAIDYKKILADLQDAVVTPVTEAAQKLIEENKDAAEFLKDRAKRVAELGVEYVKAGSDADREAALLQLDVVRQSIQNELAAVAVNASVESRAAFKTALNAALGVVVKFLPIIVAAL